ncbi:lipocalin-like domain-containing protein [Thauera sp.]|uniref:lipocalin-like domain-containing protein n=1 Tax=Thauera sp. TaxID=1905334 RepID=UPI0039E66C8F
MLIRRAGQWRGIWRRFGADIARRSLCAFAVAIALLSCLPPEIHAQDSGSAPAADGYPAVVPGRPLVFPDDFGAHPDYRTEWWYITGWLRDGAGAERGFQLTFFRVRTLIGEDNPSRFAPRQLILAHAAVADPVNGRLLHAERSARAWPGLAGAATGRTDVEIDGWSLSMEPEEGGETDGSSGDRYHSRIETEEFGFELRFDTRRPPLLNGRQGFSQKAPDPLNASHYYSRPQLGVSGSLRLGSEVLDVDGHAWLDHEWSSEILPQGARGWDWIGINLHDGGSLMLFQMRDGEGGAMWASGTLADAAGQARTFSPDEVRFEPVRHWTSPRTGTRYPVEWRLHLAGGRTLGLRPLMDDQELDSSASTGAVYWEGAVRLSEQAEDGSEREIGQGYLEMTGYAERLNM